MKFFATTTAAALLAALLTVVCAQDAPIVSVTSPLSGTVYKAGQKVIISWVNPQVPEISQIVLARGQQTALQPIAVIAKNVDASAGRYEFDMGTDCQNGNDYAFELGTSPQLAFAGPFSLEGCSGGNFASIEGGASSNSSASSAAAASSGHTNGATPAASGSSSSSSSAPSANGSTSGATSLGGGQALAVLGVALVVAGQLF